MLIATIIKQVPKRKNPAAMSLKLGSYFDKVKNGSNKSIIEYTKNIVKKIIQTIPIFECGLLTV